MSELKVNSIKGTGASTAAITIDSTAGTCTANITNNLSNRNLIINGACMLSQRSTSVASITGSNACQTTDRWKLVKSSAGTTTMSQSTDAPTDNGFAFSTKYDITTAATDLSGGHYFIHTQRLEGQDLQRFCKGTSSAKKFTLSFWVKTNKTGLYNVELHDQDNSRHCVQAYTVADSNWNKYTLSFPADTTGAFDNDANASLDINFWLAGHSGSFGTGTRATTWATFAQVNRAVGQVNINDSTSNEWYCTGVQLEVDTTGAEIATDFEHRTFGEELALCQRYYINLISGSTIFPSPNVYMATQFPTTMRAAPTVTISVTGTVGGLLTRTTGFRAVNSLGPQDAAAIAEAEL